MCYTLMVDFELNIFSLGEPMAEIELCSKPFEPDLVDTSGGKVNTRFVIKVSLTFDFNPLISPEIERVFMLQKGQLKGRINENGT